MSDTQTSFLQITFALGYWFLFALASIVSYRSNDKDSRYALIALFIASLLTSFLYSFGFSAFDRADFAIIFIDLILIFVLVKIMLSSTYEWTIWVSGLQVNVVIVHACKIAKVDIIPFAYANATAIWAWLMLIIIILVVPHVKRKNDVL